MSNANSNPLKRSLTAQLEQDSTLSSSRRREKSQHFSSQMAASSLERKLLMSQEAQRSLETQLREKDLQIERLENDRRFLADREKEARDEVESERQARDEQKRSSESSIRTLRSKLLQLEEEHEDLKDEHSNLQRTTSLTISNQKTQLQTLQHQVSQLQTEVSAFQRHARESENTVQDLRNQLEEMSLSHPAAGTATNMIEVTEAQAKDWEIVREELKRQAAYLRALESTNAKLTGDVVVLKQRAANSEILKEEKRALERKFEGVDKLRLRCAELERETEMGRKEIAALKEASENAGGLSSIAEAHRQLGELQFENVKILERLGVANSELKLKEHQVNELQVSVQKLTKQLAKAKDLMSELEAKVVKAERKVEIEKREGDFLKAMISSFEAERSVNVSRVQEDTSELNGNTSIVDERAQELLETIDELKALNLQLEASLIEAQSMGNPELIEAERKKREAAESELASLHKHSEAHLDKIEELEQTLFELRGDIGAGTHLPPGVRVLQLKDNPASQWDAMRKEALDTLRKENQALIKRLANLEEKGAVRVANANVETDTSEGNMGASVPKESWDRLEREKEALEEALKLSDKRLLRLKEVFSAKSLEFREAISAILGFKLAFYANGQVRVTSQYDLGATFVFQPLSGGGVGTGTGSAVAATDSGVKLQLVGQGEGGPRDLPQLMKYWLEGEMCIPGFMASLTLECYEKAKRSG